ncbi:MAG: hypothetical protein C0392_04180 [Syntrophus sp. (in: bacteria)]|nr:hypothetical protein [Syntrophus sp. (in: bacteria)]
MIKEYTIENFKAFGGPATVPIKPITLIFGPNSSGKSSIFQSLLMLKQTIEESPDKRQSLLAKGGLVDLGSYREFIFGHDVNREFTFKIVTTHPADLNYDSPDVIFSDNQHQRSKIIINSITGEEVGFSVTFHNLANGITSLSKTSLFIGINSNPIITYLCNYPERRSLDGYPEEMANAIKELNVDRLLLFPTLNIAEIDDNHSYWIKYCELLEEYDEDAIAFSNVEEAFKKMSDKEKKDIIEKLKLNESDVGNNIVIDNKTTKSKSYSILEKYKNSWKDNKITLNNFLPKTIDLQEVYEILSEMHSDDENADNISLITLSMANIFHTFLNSIIHIGPLRSYPERFFTFSGVTSEYVGQTGKYMTDILINNSELLHNINHYLERLHLTYELKIIPLASDAGDIHDLYAMRLLDKTLKIAISLTDVGVGVSQVLPIIVQSVLSKDKTILIEQPELHLHPAQQAELGDMFIEAALGENKNTFLIETHSEHLILRLLRRIRETSEGRLEDGAHPLKPQDIAVIYAKPTAQGTKLLELRVTDDGDFEDKWPDGFFAERAKELF